MRSTAGLAFLAFFAASAQAPAAFDVASVKPSPPSGSDALNINLGSYNHGVLTLGNTTLSECIRYAYTLVSEDQISGPDWIRDRSLRVDITAKTSPETPGAQVRLMLQSLLAERFHLQLHHESKPVRHYEVSVGKNGIKMTEVPMEAGSSLVEYHPGRLYYNHIQMATLAVLLSRQLKEPVLDLTSLSGAFNVRLDWMPDDPSPQGGRRGGAAPAENAAPAPDIFHAAEQQLGLHIEEKRTPIDVLVIDHADKVPVAN